MVKRDDTLDDGIIYVLSNEAMPGLLKIGKTTRESIDVRVRELFTTSVPVPFECEYACRVKNVSRAERALHIAFRPYRIHKQREFFEIAPEQAIELLKLLSVEDVTPTVKAEIVATIDSDSKEGLEKLRKSRPPLNYEEMRIPVGSILRYTEAEMQVTVSSPKKVLYNGEETSLTRVTQTLLGLSYAVQPTRYWTFNGRNLQDIYNETYPSTPND